MHAVITCEHAGNEIPETYRHLFVGHEETLLSHRGWDPGAWEAAAEIARTLGVKPHANFISRLLVEVNRSPYHTDVFSEFSKALPVHQQQVLLSAIYSPYRSQVERSIEEQTQPVVHLSIHTFVPVLHGVTRNVEIGLLFDPERSEEVRFCRVLKEELRLAFTGFRVEDNEPYRGIDDGLTTHLRTRFENFRYRGVEVEINQRLASVPDWQETRVTLARVMQSVIRRLS
jgi:predicted N-formylglutamate amidohydrolase